MHCFCDEFLTGFLEQYFTERNCACRKGKGVEYAQKCLINDLHEYYEETGSNIGYSIKADIHHYFQSIDHDILKESLAKILPKGEVRDFLFYIIDSFPHAGLPLGNTTSQFLALYHLHPLDALMKDKKYGGANIRYTRYVDDFIILAPSKEIAAKVLEDIKMVMQEQSLKLNEKTSIQPLSNGLGFLGWNFYLKNTGRVVMRRKAGPKRIAIDKMRDAAWLYRSGMIDARGYWNRVTSLVNVLKIGKAKGLRYVLVKMQYAMA